MDEIGHKLSNIQKQLEQDIDSAFDIEDRSFSHEFGVKKEFSPELTKNVFEVFITGNILCCEAIIEDAIIPLVCSTDCENCKTTKGCPSDYEVKYRATYQGAIKADEGWKLTYYVEDEICKS